MNNKLPLRDKLSDIPSIGVDQNGELYTIVHGPLQHDTLALELLQRIARLQVALREVYPMTLDGWVNGFLRDMNPEEEISCIEGLAATYQKFTSNTKLSLKAKKTLYAILSSMSTGVKPKHLKMIMPRGLPSVKKIYKVYCRVTGGIARPIKVGYSCC